jgi:hypothetical protein
LASNFWRRNLADADKLSLYKLVSEGGYEASVVATYSTAFPLYERVVLRRLQAAGCRHNILVADGGQCGLAMASAETRPLFSGIDYLLLPVRSAAAFHPKFIMLLGKKGARLVIGSHNVTLAGFGLNREIATVFQCEAETPSAAFASAVWGFVRAWTSDFSQRIQEVVGATERLAPWLGKGGESPKVPTVIGSEPSGQPLWERVRPYLGSPVKRVTIVSPYFDAKLAFINRLAADLQPKECLVAVHPRFTELPPNAQSLSPGARFVDVSDLADGWGDRYPHAKVYCFELASGRSVVVLGSANASAPAWLASGTNRNAELVVVHQDAEQLWKRLGLQRVTDAPALGKAGWSELKDRGSKRKTAATAAAAFLATATPEGFVVDDEFAEGLTADRVKGYGTGTAGAAIESLRRSPDGVLCVCPSDELRTSVSRLEASPAQGRKRMALIHHVSELLDKAAGTTRQAFRRALAGMEGDPDELMVLMKVVDKAIFDQGVSLDSAQQAGRPKAGKQEQSDAVRDPETLAVHAQDTARARRRRRLSASSDLALIIDLLIHRLGQGLFQKQDADTPGSVTPSEETLREEDAEAIEIDGHMLAKACRGKVNRLFRRMIGQCELVGERGKDATTPIVQMAAVLGVVRHLRTRQHAFGWLPRGERLVDREHAREFFNEASRCLFGPRLGLAAKAAAEADGQEFDELTAVRGLLSWLALDGELDTRKALEDALEDPEAVQENLVRVAYLVPVITQCAEDAFAEDLLQAVVAEQSETLRQTATYHIDWAHRLTNAIRATSSSPGPVAIGDLVLPLKVPTLWPLVVIDAQSNKTGVVDLDSGEAKYFGAGYIAKVDSLPARH